MSFHNRLLETPIPDTAIRVAFHTLKEGDIFLIEPNGKTRQIIKREFDFATVRRYDDWLVHYTSGSEGWDRMVIKINK
ncbi:MAG: hypothetical protein ABIN91_11000 [Mucilaginibacter sp.]|uniref:hypothetical protein n=1 Tax=Mucilaginibacter sp. TaxID=1882438 RepID=UPI003266A031